MKGVIMAGGKGTRLRPLTCQLPKPMVPLVQKPVMEYSIDLLKKHGITEIAVTVQYLPDAIRDYFGDGSDFGVKLHYFEEDTPLGTAGSVKQAEDFLDEPFIVVSGDALTDFDLSEGIKFHQQKNSLVTIFMKKVECPLEFGVIMTNEEEEIIRFLEKPSWSEVFSDTVNTGIYIMNPEVFSFINKDVATDFSKDVFPKLLEKQGCLYGFSAMGYWSDIGNLTQYRQAQLDILNREVKADIGGTEISPGVWVGEHVVIEDGVIVEGPVSIGNHSIIRQGARIGPHTVVGGDSTISNRASLKRSVLWNSAYVGDDSELRGATVCHDVTFGMKSMVYEDAVIGHHCTIGEEASIQPSIKLWPHKVIKGETIIHQSVVWNEPTGGQPHLKGHRAIGVANIEMTPEQATKLGAGFGSLLKPKDTVFLAGDNHPFSRLLKISVAQSLQATGIHVVDLGETMLPVLRYALEKEAVNGGIYVRMSKRKQNKQAIIEFYDEAGLPISSSTHRELDQSIAFSSFRRVAFDYVGSYSLLTTYEQSYFNELLKTVNVEQISKRSWNVLLHTEKAQEQAVVTSILQKLGCHVTVAPPFGVEKFRQQVKKSDADIGMIIGETGEFMTLITEQGEIVTEEEQLSLYVYMQLRQGTKKQIAIPLFGGPSLEEMAVSFDTELIRTKGTARAMMEAEETVQMYLYDSLYALTHVLDLLTAEREKLSDQLQKLPTEIMYKEEVACRTEKKGVVMRKLMESFTGKEVELIDGMKIRHQEGGWTFIVPDQDQPTFTIYAQAKEEIQAKELANEYVEQINRFKQ
ncbi:sugar phosphate nucleotidyltransferase [Bacillus solitudinis]|uniref:sugar phosphate nucleotidyltransferase n=1 Tax=Bacillus solitudinis TaxID=2014074 RepID=UPI000C243888|nr:sugar phosphate nucleotidyltransferase [Bacillus solitudinis]